MTSSYGFGVISVGLPDEAIDEMQALRAAIKNVVIDKIIEIEGEVLENMSTEQAMAKIKGERNTKVHLKISREGQIDPLSFEVPRDVIKEQNSLCFHIKDHDIY